MESKTKCPVAASAVTLTSPKEKHQSMYTRWKEYVSSVDAPSKALVEGLLDQFEKLDVKNKDHTVLTFGKYKGSSVSELMNVKAAREYFEWMLKQPWSKEERHKGLIAEIGKYDLSTGKLKKE